MTKIIPILSSIMQRSYIEIENEFSRTRLNLCWGTISMLRNRDRCETDMRSRWYCTIQPIGFHRLSNKGSKIHNTNNTVHLRKSSHNFLQQGIMQSLMYWMYFETISYKKETKIKDSPLFTGNHARIIRFVSNDRTFSRQK